jgi:hypothetical protein
MECVVSVASGYDQAGKGGVLRWQDKENGYHGKAAKSILARPVGCGLGLYYCGLGLYMLYTCTHQKSKGSQCFQKSRNIWGYLVFLVSTKLSVILKWWMTYSNKYFKRILVVLSCYICCDCSPRLWSGCPMCIYWKQSNDERLQQESMFS